MQGIIDSTLREGAQTVGVSFSLPQKINIVHQLIRIGVEEIELGVANERDQHLPALIRAARRVVAPRLALWSRCLATDIDFAATLQPDVLSLSIPSSDLHLQKRITRERAWAFSAMETAIRRALAAGIPIVSVGFEDASRADRSFLLQLAAAAKKAGASRLRLADTVGVASPLGIQELVTTVRKHSSLEIGVHTHNDFGMATANAVAALEAGADWADTTVLGLGERAGNAKLEEVVGYLALRKKIRDYNMHALKKLCHDVAQAANRTISSQHPLVGDGIFSCETGLHLQGLVREPSTYEPFSPEMVGSERRLLFGEKIGHRAVADQLDFLGLPKNADWLQKAVDVVRKHALGRGRPLNKTELKSLALEIF